MKIKRNAKNGIVENESSIQNLEQDKVTIVDDLNDQSEIPFQVGDFGAYNLEDMLKVSNKMVIAAFVHFGKTHKNI